MTVDGIIWSWQCSMRPAIARLCAVQLLAVSCDITRLAPVVRSVVWSGSLLYDVAVQVINDPD
jgi:hypothetical protein